MTRALSFHPPLGALLLLAAGSFASAADATLFSAGPTGGELNVPVRDMMARRYAGIVRQQFDFSCGSAALATLLRDHYGRPVGERDTFLGMWREGDKAAIRRVGFSLLDMKRYLANVGLKADGYTVSLDQIRKTGLPGIALVTVQGYRHFVVIKGVDAEHVLIGDPSTGLRRMERPAFEAAWNKVFFALNSAQPVGRASFNTPRQWSRLATAPIGQPFAGPLSEQALGLAAPFYREF